MMQAWVHGGCMRASECAHRAWSSCLSSPPSMMPVLDLPLPFTRQAFFDVFARYNVAIWPAQVVAYALIGIAIFWICGRARHASLMALLILAVAWLWTGIAYHMLFFAPINEAAILFGLLFICQGGLFLVYAARKPPALSLESPTRGVAFVLLIYAALLYPLVNSWTGHAFPATPMFGVTPCPLVIGTFGFLLLTSARAPWALLAIPLVWSIIGGSAAWLFDMGTDLALPISAVLTLWLNAKKLPPQTGRA